jgi:hypothetical protein
VTFAARALVEYPSGWTCEVTLVRLERYVVESLPRQEMLAVGEHLEACSECPQALELLRAGNRHG